jgi:hypothetical protein
MNENIMIITNSTFTLKRSKIALLILSSLFISACNETKPINTEKSASLSEVKALPLKNADDLAPYLNRNIQDEVFYFVMPDRFYN